MGGVRKCSYPRCYTRVCSLGEALPHGGAELAEALATAVQLRDAFGQLLRQATTKKYQPFAQAIQHAEKARQKLEEQLAAITEAQTAYLGAKMLANHSAEEVP